METPEKPIERSGMPRKRQCLPAAARERWVLVRQGEGPARKWVWQLATSSGKAAPGDRAQPTR